MRQPPSFPPQHPAAPTPPYSPPQPGAARPRHHHGEAAGSPVPPPGQPDRASLAWPALPPIPALRPGPHPPPLSPEGRPSASHLPTAAGRAQRRRGEGAPRRGKTASRRPSRRRHQREGRKRDGGGPHSPGSEKERSAAACQEPPGEGREGVGAGWLRPAALKAGRGGMAAGGPRGEAGSEAGQAAGRPAGARSGPGFPFLPAALARARPSGSRCLRASRESRGSAALCGGVAAEAGSCAGWWHWG